MKKYVYLLLSWVLIAAAQSYAAVTSAGRSAMEAARNYGAAVRSCDMAWALDMMYPQLKMILAERLDSRQGNERENALITMKVSENNPAQAAARQKRQLEALRKLYEDQGRQMQAGGIRIESFRVLEPVAEYEVNPPSGLANAARRDEQGLVQADQLQGMREVSRVVVLPTVLVVRAPRPDGSTQRIERRSHIYAIRDEKVAGAVNRNGITRRGTKLNTWYFIDATVDVNTLRTFFPNLPQHLTLPDSGDRILR